jgi:hypothetical protein
MTLALPGCMYGNRIKQQGVPATGEYIVLVQNAMELYQKKTGVLPIRNKDADTPEYERYWIDFKKLKDAQILSTVPANAFENGGTAIYVVASTETTPKVKLLDLISFQQIADLQKAVDRYRKEHRDTLPKGEAVSPGYWQLDFAKLNRSAEQIRSPYSAAKLYPVMDEDGKVGIDYSPEILRVVQKKGLKPDNLMDLRDILLDEAYFVPACSFPYRWSGEAPRLSVS